MSTDELELGQLTKEEEKLFKLFRSHPELSLDVIEAKLKVKRHACIVRVKYLAAKVAPLGWIIQRTSGIGRSVKATYEMQKKF